MFDWTPTSWRLELGSQRRTQPACLHRHVECWVNHTPSAHFHSFQTASWDPSSLLHLISDIFILSAPTGYASILSDRLLKCFNSFWSSESFFDAPHVSSDVWKAFGKQENRRKPDENQKKSTRCVPFQVNSICTRSFHRIVSIYWFKVIQEHHSHHLFLEDSLFFTFLKVATERILWFFQPLIVNILKVVWNSWNSILWN